MKLLNGQTILIVDDNIDDRFFVGRALKRLATGLGIQFVTGGEEAAAYLDGSGVYADRTRFPYPSFVVTDLVMPDGDGFSVLRRIRTVAPTPPPVMVLSDWDDPADIRRAQELGANRFCRKPTDISALPPMISKFLYSDSAENVDRLMPIPVA